MVDERPQPVRIWQGEQSKSQCPGNEELRGFETTSSFDDRVKI
jgi:hypothetical protein